MTDQAAQPPSAFALSADIQAGSTVVRQRLARALSNPLRIRILVELNKRAMSASQFMAEIGGPSLSAVSKQFRYLEKLGCIELVETKTGGGRRGGTEHFFRAVQRALFDNSSWTAVPPSRRGDVTGETVTTYIDRVVEAIEAGTINTRVERHFTWTAMHFDEQAWREMISATDSQFGRSLRVGVEAGVRLAKSGETPIPVTMAFACFESPPAEMRPLKGLLAERLMGSSGFQTESNQDGNDSWAFVSQRLARAMKHPLRVRILVELNKRAMSASEFTNEYEGRASLSVVSKHFRYLERLGCIELVDTKSGGQRRGRTEYFFRATQRSLFDESSWSNLPDSVKAEITGVTLTTYVERLAAAVAAGTMDARLDRHLTWTGMRFDERAWGEMVSATDDLFRKAVTLQLEAASRLETSGETPISVTTGFSCFESPRDSMFRSDYPLSVDAYRNMER